jgi:hypothetical protein
LDNYLRFLALLTLKGVALAFYRPDGRGIDGGRIPGYPWDDVRVICFLNHTSLFEPLFAAVVPNRFIWQIATRAVVPIAQITLDRPIVGRILKMLVAHPVAITREPDHTWEALLAAIKDDSMVIIMPEGRMRRGTGLDRDSKPMSARGGVTQIFQRLQHGQLLMAYSGGLHHVQIPGERWPRVFKTLSMRFELLEIADYLQEMRARGRMHRCNLKNMVKSDLDRRRDLYCPITQESTRQPVVAHKHNM